jgi:glycolate oxidase FAD binding subunit
MTPPQIVPRDEAEIADAVRDSAQKDTSLEIISGGTKRDLGRVMRAAAILDVAAVSGILKYEPEELVLTVRAATPIAEIEVLLAEKKQMLGFSPADWGPLFGAPGGRATLAGIVAANACGSRKVKAGAVRDHVIGCRFVNGSGEAIKAGGHVIKNVTGFDLPKLMCGAFGTLGVLTELTMRVSPAPERVAGLVILDCAAETGLGVLRWAARLAVDASGLAYLPHHAMAHSEVLDADGSGIAIIRVDGTAPAVSEKLALLRREFADRDLALLEADRTDALFREIGSGSFFAKMDSDIWRLSVPASQAYAALQDAGASFWYADWAGGLLWLEAPANDETAARLRGITQRFGGHATLMRAASKARMRLPVFEPEAPVRAALTRAVKAAFDPKHVLNPGRMFEGI